MTVRRAQLLGALLAFVAFLVVVQQVMTDGRLVELDRDLADHYGRDLLGRVRSIAVLVGEGRAQSTARMFTPFGDAVLLMVAVGALALLLFRQGRRRESVYVATASVGGVVLDLVARVTIGHLRPDLPFPYFVISRFGLPSGHALDATVCYGAILVVVWPRLSPLLRIVATIATAVLVAGVSYSRVVLLTHYLSDVIGGVTLGLAWLLLVTAAFSLPDRDRLPSAA